jgi:membrane protein
MNFIRTLTRKKLAASPRQFKFEDWKEALLATKDSISGKRINILAAGIAYFMTLAFFPLIAATIAISGFLLDASQINDAARSIEAFFPKDIAGLLNDQLSAALQNKSANIAVAVVSIAIALFGVSGAAQNAIDASNVAYEVQENRNFIKLKLVSFAVLLIFMITGLLIICTLLLNADALMNYGVPSFLARTLSVGRWILLPIVLSIALAAFYRYGPNRDNPHWQWVTWGSVIAAVLWLIVTAAFFIYARFFAHFSESYGALAGLIVLMTWLNLSAFVILLGAEINHRLEQKTLLGTTK